MKSANRKRLGLALIALSILSFITPYFSGFPVFNFEQWGGAKSGGETFHLYWWPLVLLIALVAGVLCVALPQTKK